MIRLCVCVVLSLLLAAAQNGRGQKIDPAAGGPLASPPVAYPVWLATGMVKPVSEVREYNGTYFGSYGTGSVGYTTLYRDNEDGGSQSGCFGEGCGRHPAVDIPVSSGTAVFACLSGTVVRSECTPGTSGWGGLVVVRCQSSWQGETLYFTYAHLKERYVSVGQYVAAGQVIALSGGNPARDGCSGNSTGSHLHFQIDRDDGNSSPWFPSGGDLQQRDNDFRVCQYTYNPMVFIQGGYRWRFDQSGDREGFDLLNIGSWGVSGGALWVDPGFDTYVVRGGETYCGKNKPCSTAITAEASQYSSVLVDMYRFCSSNPAKVYFTTKDEPYWSESKSVSFWPGGAGYFRGSVWMRQNAKWAGVITGIRLDPAETCSATERDYIYLGEITIER
jgi:murein DD-endopeptidase MepM/ murein hydrolase activator NlpD